MKRPLSLDMDYYQDRALSTAIYGRQEVLHDVLRPMALAHEEKEFILNGMRSIMGLSYTAMGLAGEAGEVANKVKKILRGDVLDDQDMERRKEALKGELGGVLWYLAACAHELGFDLSDVARYNLDELQKRNAAGTIKGDGDGQNRTTHVKVA